MLTPEHHALRCAEQTPDETLFVCDLCGRRLVLNPRGRRMTVLDKGDFFALHSGGTGGVSMQPPVVRP